MDVEKELRKLNGWELKEGKIVKSYSFKSFMEGIEFVNDVAKIAEKRDHHPIITVSWKTVKISSISFDVGHITDRDFALAEAIDDLYSKKFATILNLEEEHRLLAEEERKERARKRTRGPYRKSSRAGFRR
ncbi:MAG: 4a-hydroxytetrahydrobiopterin dehydratase [Nitrososphaerales archaeon]